MSHDVVFFPDYRSANPYQAMLYDHAASGLVVGPGPVEKALAAIRLGGGRPVIFHLHWEDAVYRNEADEPMAWAAAQAFLTTLEQFRDAGGRVLWTMHNAGPHDGRYPAVHKALVELLPRLVDVVHVHGHAAAEIACERHGFRPSQIAVVAHGNSLPRLRPLRGDPTLCRESLGLPKEGRVLLLFGRLAAYKGAAELLAAFAASDPSLRLMLAGRQIDRLDDDVAALPPAVRDRVHLRDGFVPEAELPLLFHAVDAMVAPYRGVLTSGAAMLALSMERPVIAPAHPGLREVLTDGHDAILYPPGSLEAALRRLTALHEADLVAMRAAAAATARRYDWGSLGLLLDGVFHRLRALHRPYRVTPAMPAPIAAPAAPRLAPSGRVAEG